HNLQYPTGAVRVLPGPESRLELLESEPGGTAVDVRCNVRRGERPELATSGQELLGVDDRRLARVRIPARRKCRVGVTIIAGRHRVDDVAAQADERAVLVASVEGHRG